MTPSFTRSDFVDYLKRAENQALYDTGDGAYTLHASPEGGTPTLGYGHKLTIPEYAKAEVYGYDIYSLTEKQCEVILEHDLSVRETQLAAKIPEWDTLADWQHLMLLEIEYNCGSVLTRWPSFTKYVLAGDPVNAIRESKRTYRRDGKRYSMDRRNQMFKELVLG